MSGRARTGGQDVLTFLQNSKPVDAAVEASDPGDSSCKRRKGEKTEQHRQRKSDDPKGQFVLERVREFKARAQFGEIPNLFRPGLVSQRRNMEKHWHMFHMFLSKSKDEDRD